jgi:predicted RecB family nuclease
MTLSKSDFLAGLQCPRHLWWRRHEPDAVELQPDKVLQDLFDQGNQVGELARTQFPDGVLIDHRRGQFTEAVQRTSEAMAAGADVVFEAAFHADGLNIAADVMLRRDDGWHLIEVKSSSQCKEEHVADAAVQAHVLAANGVAPVQIDIMHLNREFLHPDVGELFARTDVSAAVPGTLLDVAAEARRQLTVLEGPLPDVEIGAHCFEPRKCAFHARCWPADERHISTLYLVGEKRTITYMASGVHTVDDLPKDAKLPPAARRQLRALELGTMIVEPTLAHDLEELSDEPLGFLDFETIARAIPVWPAMAPWGQAAAQFSYHESRGDGTYVHVEHLAEGPEDARPIVAERLVEATQRAKKVVMYSSFEKTQIRALAKAVPNLAGELVELEGKLVDLLKVVRDNVYHPGFRGSFSIKAVLPALVPELSYNDLVIVNGMVASVEIARLLFVADRIPLAERDRVRSDLLEYCKRDTWATVRLVEELRKLAGRGTLKLLN